MSSILSTFFGNGRKKCQHSALASLTGTNRHVLDFDFVSNSSTRNIPIEYEFFKRVHELKNFRIDNFRDVEKLIKKFDSTLRGQRLDILKSLYDSDHRKFIASMRVIQSVAIKYLCCMPEKMPLLVQGIEAEVSLSQFQIACILANFFFLNEPYKIDRKYENDYPNLQFKRLFISERQSDDNLKCEKLKFLFSYFHQLNDQISNGVVTFQRQGVRKEGIDWANSNKTVLPIEFSTGKMEEGIKNGYSEVDFANEMVGGGVLGQGAVQEEIRFLMSPELIISRLFTQRLSSTEAVVITGAQIFSLGEGYSKNLRFKRRYRDQSQPDHFNRRPSQIIAIDAFRFDADDKGRQFDKNFIDRELNKAFAGFKRITYSRSETIASGKWGCGTFNGDPHLKCFIQMMAATQARRNLVIYTFGDRKLCDEIMSVYRLLHEKNVTIGKLYQLLLNYSHHSSGANICQFIQNILNDREKVKKTEIDDAFEEGFESNVPCLINLWGEGTQPKSNLSLDEQYGHQFQSQNRSEYQNQNIMSCEIASASGYEDPLRNQGVYKNKSNFSGRLCQKISIGEYGSEEQPHQYTSSSVHLGGESSRRRSQERIQGFENSNRNSYPDSCSAGYKNEDRVQGRIYQNKRSAYPNNTSHPEINNGGSDSPLIDLSDDGTKNGINKYSVQRHSNYQNPSTMELTCITSGLFAKQGIRYESGHQNQKRNIDPYVGSSGYSNQEQIGNERWAHQNARSNVYEQGNPIQGRSNSYNLCRNEYPGMNNRKHGNQTIVQSKGKNEDQHEKNAQSYGWKTMYKR